MKKKTDAKFVFNYNKLRGRIVEKFGSCSAFADRLGMYRQVVSYKLNGRIGITRDDIVVWRDLLDIEQDEIGIYFFDLESKKLDK